jgi:aspartate-semialdehyde dehydrogenase
MSKSLNIAVVGATGLVGRTMLKVLQERRIEYHSIKLLASERSAGQYLKINDEDIKVQELKESSFDNIDIALFSAGGTTSKKYAPIAAEKGAFVIDNSSAWRMSEGVPLVVPEVNFHAINENTKIIANPNCSTIQLVIVLDAIMKKYGLKRVVCSTYQSISGAGQKGVDQLTNEIYEIIDDSKNIKHRIAYNAIFHPASDFNGFTEEEKKMLFETRKILNDDSLKLAFTCVRLPILGGHAESVNIETEQKAEVENIRELLSTQNGIQVVDNIEKEDYPTPKDVENNDDVFVGRIRKDDSVENGFYLWIVADNLRKGAATNAVQIAERLIDSDII